jgi:import inner membrane translocase subunit TIM22
MSSFGGFGGQQSQNYFDMTPEQQAQAGAAAMVSLMQSCPGKSAIAGVTGFGIGGLFGLFMASVCETLSSITYFAINDR